MFLGKSLSLPMKIHRRLGFVVVVHGGWVGGALGLEWDCERDESELERE